MFWDFCKGYKSNIPLNGIPTITGIPIVATAAASVTPKSNVSRTPSFRPSAAFPQADTGFAGFWMAISSLIVALIGAVMM
jgi:hypothetical protein